MDVTSLISAIFGFSAFGGGAFLAGQARSKQKTAEAKWNAAEARREELELRFAEQAEQVEQAPKRTPREKTSAREAALATTLREREAALTATLGEREAALATAAKERDAALKRVAVLQSEIEEIRFRAGKEQKRLLDERRKLESDYEASITDLKQIAAAATAAVPAVLPSPVVNANLPAPSPANGAQPTAADDLSGPPSRLPRPKGGVPANGARMKNREAVPLLLAAAEPDAAELGDAMSVAGYAVLKATTATDMLRIARESHPAMIVLDALLGKRGGDEPFAVLSALKSDEALRDIPVLMICPVKDRERATELGAAGCVGAPAAPNVLLGAVNAAFVAHKKRAERSRLAMAAKGPAA
jgi:CheY-like chemotaxis protein